MQPEQQNNPSVDQELPDNSLVVPPAQPVVQLPTEPESPAQQQPSPEPQDQPPSQPELDSSDEQLDMAGPVQWQAPEYIEQQKSLMWFVGFWGAVVLLMLVAAFVIKAWSFTILVPVMAAALMFYSHRPPRMMNYVASEKGIYINEQLHPMSEFRSFGVLQDEAMPALMLIPTKRFRPGLTVYFPQEAGESIVDLLGSRIPIVEPQLDVFDRIVRKLRI